jgi:L-lysine 6-transaminase
MTKDISGVVFGKWKALMRDNVRSTNHHTYWICQCECGKVKPVSMSDLKHGKSKQCVNCSNQKNKAKKTGHMDISGSYWCRLKGGAKHRELPFEIKIEYAWGLFLQQGGRCALSGQEISLVKGFDTASMDRIDSTKGYIHGNVQWVHKTINRLKNNHQDEVFIELCHGISDHQKKKRETAKSVIPRLEKYVLVDGFRIVPDFQRSFGSWLVDEQDGKRYLDCFGQFSSQALGWNHPSLITHVWEHPEALWIKVAHSDVYTKAYLDFAIRLSNTMPEFEDFFFINSGALAVDNALKAAFDWKVQKLGIQDNEEAINKLDVVHFENAFHGRSGYALSCTCSPEKTKWFPRFNWSRLPIDNNGLDKLEILLKEDNVASVIIEPILGEGGDVHVDAQFLDALRSLTLKYEALLIFDEVQTGFSTGKPWCYQHFDNIVPDLVTFGKKLQVCGVATTGRLLEVKNNVFTTSGRINSTWGPDIADLIRGELILKIIEEESLLTSSARVGDYFLGKLKEINLLNARGRGLMIAFDLPTTEERDKFYAKLTQKMLCLKCGLKSIRFRPHLSFIEEDADAAVRILKECL